jgi:hypothetical protein
LIIDLGRVGLRRQTLVQSPAELGVGLASCPQKLLTRRPGQLNRDLQDLTFGH